VHGWDGTGGTPVLIRRSGMCTALMVYGDNDTLAYPSTLRGQGLDQ
jgi:hypothetical protein